MQYQITSATMQQGMYHALAPASSPKARRGKLESPFMTASAAQPMSPSASQGSTSRLSTTPTKDLKFLSSLNTRPVMAKNSGIFTGLVSR